MLLSSTLFLLFLECCSAKKEGDFGLLTGCFNRNGSLLLKCWYPACPGSPNFNCEFKTEEGILLASSHGPYLHSNDSAFSLSSKDGTCSLLLNRHQESHAKNITSYNCTLIRNQRKEEKNITINYSIMKGNDRIRPCSTAGLLLHRAPSLLWPLILQLL